MIASPRAFDEFLDKRLEKALGEEEGRIHWKNLPRGYHMSLPLLVNMMREVGGKADLTIGPWVTITITMRSHAIIQFIASGVATSDRKRLREPDRARARAQADAAHNPQIASNKGGRRGDATTRPIWLLAGGRLLAIACQA